MDNRSFPSQIGPYQILRSLGSGASAEILLAKVLPGAAAQDQYRFAAENQPFAIKWMLPNINTEQAIRAFQNEAIINASLSHPNICKVYGYAHINNNHCILMEYIQGKNLQQWLQYLKLHKTSFPVPASLFITLQILKALAYAHDHKDANGVPLDIIHRDISPHNILISYQARVKLIDFGIANANVERDATRAGIIKGKLSYMAPEHALGRSIDRRADLYSLAVTLYQMLCGENPLETPNQYETYQNVITSRFPPIEQRLPQLPQNVLKLIHKSLQNDPAKRYQNAEAFAQDIERALAVNYANYQAQKFLNDINSLTTFDAAPHYQSPAPSVRPPSLTRNVKLILFAIPALLGTLLGLILIIITILATT
ncbi:MAG: serine/threonine-protein kinase [Bradymonadales bacterium]|jgi:serine/threonine protein kinase